MAQIRHIAISSNDPPKAAEFYKKMFGLTELNRKPADTGDKGVYLSDGYIFFAIIKQKSNDSMTSADAGFHFGFDVEDLEKTCANLRATNVRCVIDGVNTSGEKILQYEGPDGVIFEVEEHGWDKRISSKMDLYQLTLASPPTAK